MKTKSGKSHFACEFRLYDPDGHCYHEDLNFTFTSFSAELHRQRANKRYGAWGCRAEYKNVKNLDE